MSTCNLIPVSAVGASHGNKHVDFNVARTAVLSRDESNQLARECLAFIGIARCRESGALAHRTLGRTPTFVFDEARELFTIAINKVNENHPNHYAFRDRLEQAFGPLHQAFTARIDHCLITIVPDAAKQ
jgi:hypothetical protein